MPCNVQFLDAGMREERCELFHGSAVEPTDDEYRPVRAARSNLWWPLPPSCQTIAQRFVCAGAGPCPEQHSPVRVVHVPLRPSNVHRSQRRALELTETEGFEARVGPCGCLEACRRPARRLQPQLPGSFQASSVSTCLPARV
eukprot:CAMPEP_0114613834 /NCGR_PEP_ID=MMETSP0168-20121206/5339_1 /TAXON_ID=95228 ORGANISM="Vannella sp., Strain DIVA3 517/6/12" /NCGR_SAMPLE_ID=MMETSP0168 /ASSEMBLY_ACC=CAM_ASM_000044 /LENGTH=141 /DNA_ID=CAMNT_0001824857 /DNA_START=169 /DNA_END=594 /DNA_ORIENTATION=+